MKKRLLALMTVLLLVFSTTSVNARQDGSLTGTDFSTGSSGDLAAWTDLYYFQDSNGVAEIDVQISVPNGGGTTQYVNNGETSGGQTATITATPDNHYVFKEFVYNWYINTGDGYDDPYDDGGRDTIGDGFSLDVQENGNVMSIAAQRASEVDIPAHLEPEIILVVQAHFELKEYTVSVSATTGGAATVDGQISVTEPYGTKVFLVAVPDEGYEFVKWTRDWDNDSKKSDNPNATTRTKFDKSFTAVFAAIEPTTYPVVTISDDINQGSTYPTSEDDIWVEEGEETTVVASPEPGHEFVGWYAVDEKQEIQEDSGDPFAGLILISTDPEYTFSVSGPVYLIGFFQPEPVEPPTPEPPTPEPPTPTQYTLTVNVIGGGSVPGFEGTNTFSSGTNVNLSPTADEGFTFIGWSGDTGSLTGDSLIMTGDITLTATFDDGEDIDDEELPEAPVPDNLEDLAATPDVILDDVIPESSPVEDIEDDVLPQTGGIPATAASLFGSMLIGAGAIMKKKSK